MLASSSRPPQESKSRKLRGTLRLHLELTALRHYTAVRAALCEGGYLRGSHVQHLHPDPPAGGWSDLGLTHRHALWPHLFLITRTTLPGLQGHLVQLGIFVFTRAACF